MRELKPTKTNPELPVRSRRLFEPAFPALGGGLFDFSPFRFISTISDEMDKIMRGNGRTESEFWAPPVEVTEFEGKLMITAELPGLKKEEVKVEVVDGALTIEGERKHETEEKKEGYFRTERTYGRFFRSIPLPETARTNEIKAELKNGVLEVAIPVPEMKPNRRTITVHEGPQAATTTA